jgi:hypothetical protein
MKKTVILLDSEKLSIKEIDTRLRVFHHKYHADREDVRKKIMEHVELETDEILDDLMIWKALELAKDRMAVFS